MWELAGHHGSETGFPQQRVLNKSALFTSRNRSRERKPRAIDWKVGKWGSGELTQGGPKGTVLGFSRRDLCRQGSVVERRC